MLSGENQLMTKQEVLKFFGGGRPIHYSTLWRGMRDGSYPRPVAFSQRTKRWLRSECVAALQRRIAERDGQEAA